MSANSPPDHVCLPGLDWRSEAERGAPIRPFPRHLPDPSVLLALDILHPEIRGEFGAPSHARSFPRFETVDKLLQSGEKSLSLAWIQPGKICSEMRESLERWQRLGPTPRPTSRASSEAVVDGGRLMISW